MKNFKIPNFLEDVFGEEQSLFSIGLILLFAFMVTGFLVERNYQDFASLSIWRVILSILLIFDISAGCVANFSRGTSSYYATRAKNRWWFIAIHFHIIILAIALGSSLWSSLVIWIFTIICACFVNFLFHSPHQKLLAGFFLGLGLILTVSLSWDSNILQAMGALFLMKVVYSFGVNHYLE